jgi:hypothetical protein
MYSNILLSGAYSKIGSSMNAGKLNEIDYQILKELDVKATELNRLNGYQTVSIHCYMSSRHEKTARYLESLLIVCKDPEMCRLYQNHVYANDLMSKIYDLIEVNKNWHLKKISVL